MNVHQIMKDRIFKFFCRTGKNLKILTLELIYFYNRRTTGLEPANGGITTHCLNQLGYARLRALTLHIYDVI